MDSIIDPAKLILHGIDAASDHGYLTVNGPNRQIHSVYNFLHVGSHTLQLSFIVQNTYLGRRHIFVQFFKLLQKLSVCIAIAFKLLDPALDQLLYLLGHFNIFKIQAPHLTHHIFIFRSPFLQTFHISCFSLCIGFDHFSCIESFCKLVHKIIHKNFLRSLNFVHHHNFCLFYHVSKSLTTFPFVSRYFIFVYFVQFFSSFFYLLVIINYFFMPCS